MLRYVRNFILLLIFAPFIFVLLMIWSIVAWVVGLFVDLEQPEWPSREEGIIYLDDYRDRAVNG